MKKNPEFPFLPKSTAQLSPGMIWDIRLRDGSFGCGRVLSIAGRLWSQRRFEFWGGLLRWHGEVCPTVDLIAGAPVLWQGHFDVRSLAKSESRMRDILPLEVDGLIIPPILTSMMNGEVMIGYDEDRSATDEEFRTLPVMTGGVDNDSFREIAEDIFLDGKPMKWGRRASENDFLDRIGLMVPGDLTKVENEIRRKWRSIKKSKTTRRKNCFFVNSGGWFSGEI
jgi:hypothetical protein